MDLVSEINVYIINNLYMYEFNTIDYLKVQLYKIYFCVHFLLTFIAMSDY